MLAVAKFCKPFEPVNDTDTLIAPDERTYRTTLYVFPF